MQYILLKSFEITVSNNSCILETGEQLAVGVTILLSLVVFFLMVETRVPNTSDHLPLLSKYYCCTVIEISAVLAVTCIIHKFEHRGAVPLPSWVKVSFFVQKRIVVNYYNNWMQVLLHRKI